RRSSCSGIDRTAVRRLEHSHMKRPWLAFTLSFFLPGAGLWYLGKWAWGFVNLATVLAIGAISAFTLSDETLEKYGQLVGVGCGSGSAGLAMSITQQLNQGGKKGGGE